ncbi:hypothetical protein HELRODRAFT_97665 [Helobdella robusta]|uniref:Solute carrier organic anion transporter family member n=1 Tax=Helobdella robusta TaxID=6412 RepID=T1G9I5_HELRO|nr:hypothetical protein HELRODRAFT_97665 [Helobdella robusta]ESO09595.1 hypothetical protein HELRODRAFT_97665 [Helobdella robusta]
MLPTNKEPEKLSIVDSLQGHIGNVERFLETSSSAERASNLNFPSQIIVTSFPTTIRLKYGCFHKFFMKIGTFLCVACCFVALQGMVVSGFVSVCLSTLERRFKFSSTESGIIAMGYDLASIICLVPVSFYGGLGHKPRWIAVGALVMGVGSLVFSSPNLLVGPYFYDTRKDPSMLCLDSAPVNRSGTMEKYECSYQATTSSSIYIVIFMLGHMLHGAGSTPLFTLAVAFIDENVGVKRSPLYFSIYYSTAMIGPALGYIIGGRLLKTYIDIGRKNSTLNQGDLTPEDPRWLGAWWIGFLVTGSAFIILSIFLCGFPREMPSRFGNIKFILKIQRKRSSLESVDKKSVDAVHEPADIFHALKTLLSNPAFDFITFSGCMEGALVGGFVLFAPKFVEAAFNLSASWSGQLIGIATIPSGSLGIVIGGIIVKKFHLSAIGSLKFTLVFLGIALLLTLSMLVRCGDILYVGISHPYLDQEVTNSKINLFSGCNKHCNCSGSMFSPVCGLDGLTYVSPCLAGCQSMKEIKEKNGTWRLFIKCTCVEDRLEHNNIKTKKPYTLTDDVTASDGTCKNKCNSITFFIIFYSLIIFVSFICWTPVLTATLRCVAERHKSLALGLQWMIVRIVGMIPAPMIFGAIIDRACLFWNRDYCFDRTGSCAIYTGEMMGIYFLSIVITLKTLSFFFILIAAICLKKSKFNSNRNK